jgi:death-on-curing protein
LIESALERPRNIFRYEKHANTPRLAAAYCFSLAKNHGFVDGNKRVAAVVCELFLKLNGYRLSASDAEWLEVILAVAEGSFDETALTRWLEEHTSAIQSVRS